MQNYESVTHSVSLSVDQYANYSINRWDTEPLQQLVIQKVCKHDAVQSQT